MSFSSSSSCSPLSLLPSALLVRHSTRSQSIDREEKEKEKTNSAVKTSHSHQFNVLCPLKRASSTSPMQVHWWYRVSEKRTILSDSTSGERTRREEEEKKYNSHACKLHSSEVKSLEVMCIVFAKYIHEAS